MIIGLFLILVMGFLGSVSAITGSIGNARMVVYAKTGDTIDKYILVKNTNNETINIEMYAEGNLSKYIDIKEPKFSLAPGEDKKSEFTIKVAKEGTTETRINVKFSPVEGKNGVGLSSTIIVVAEKGDGPVDFGDGSDTGTDTETNSTSPIDSITQKLFGKDSQIGLNIMSIKGIAISLTILLVIVFIVLYLISKKRNVKEKGFNEAKQEIKHEIKPKKESAKKWEFLISWFFLP